ncbi:MAG: hypothetical protein ACOZB3_04970 [Calditrichota bacterium]
MGLLKIFDRLPDLWGVRFLFVLIVLSVAVAALQSFRLNTVAYLALFALLLGFVAWETHRIERKVRSENDEDEDLPVHALFHRSMNGISSVLFVFGVVSLWPWLGEMYGTAYFWILVLGVLSPILFFWGRIRQPKHEGSLNALYRFNRVLPYVGIILLLAIAVG